MPRVLYEYQVELHRVLDLADELVRDHIGVSGSELTGEDWTLCQAIGAGVHAAGDQAIRTYSAAGVDNVLVVFPDHAGSGLLHVRLVEQWDTSDQLR